jgi:hypothetical protein
MPRIAPRQRGAAGSRQPPPLRSTDMKPHANLYAALRRAFPADLERVAIETADTPESLA